MRKSHFKDSERNYGGGYGEVGNSESGSLTVIARVSNGSSRYAMPSMPKLVYAALLYKDDNAPANPEPKDFVQGTETEDGKLNFSFQKPENTNGTFTLEIFAFEKTSDDEEGTADFSKDKALLSGKKDGLSINGDTIEIDGTIALAISSTEPGTVSLKIKVPDGCSLFISEKDEAGESVAESESHFTITGTSPNYAVKQKVASGIPAKAYPLTFTVKKGAEIIHIFSEYINVINGFCTDTWGGLQKDETKVISQSMISSTVYVRGTGGWYDKPEHYKNTATASDSNSGSFLSPLATIQKAIDKIIAINDGASEYTIYVDGTLTATDTKYLGADGTTATAGANGMADFSKCDKNLNLTIKALSGTATLDANKLSRVINAKPESGALNLSLENLTITGGNSSKEGGGIYFGSTGGTFTISDGTTIKGNTASGNGGNVYVAKGTFKMERGGTISGGNATQGGGVYVRNNGTFTMKGGEISGNNATYGGGVFVFDTESAFTMNGGTISNCNATSTSNGCGGGGIYSAGTLTITGGTISNCNATSTSNNSGGGGGIYSAGTLSITGGMISDCTAKSGGGIYVYDKLSMSGGTISGNNASYGKGAYLSSTGKLNMSGTAQFAESDDVYIYASGSNIPTITITDTLTASTPVATITPSAYTENIPLLSAGDGVTLDGSICNKFAVKPQADGTEWRVALDGTAGVLIRKYEMGDTGPGGGAVCNYYSNGFTVNGKTCHYLECSKEQLGTMTWCPCTSSSGYCEPTLSNEIGAGYANTQAILSHPNHASATASNCAAKACAEYSTDTTEKGEWFLPSQNEVLYIYRGISVASEEPLWMSQASSDGDNSKAGYIKVRSNGSTATRKSKNIVTGVRAMRAF